MERGLDRALAQRLSISRVHDISRLFWELPNKPPSVREGTSLGADGVPQRNDGIFDECRTAEVKFGITLLNSLLLDGPTMDIMPGNW